MQRTMTKPGRKSQIHKKGDRTQQEQIRKRRHNLFKRLGEFHDRYNMEICITMKMPSNRIYIFSTYPDGHIPTEEEMVRHKTAFRPSLLIHRGQNKHPVIRKSPADYTSKRQESQDLFTIRDPPPLLLPRPPYDRRSPLST